MRTTTETVSIKNNKLTVTVNTNDGIEFNFPVESGNSVKEFETALSTARRGASGRRIWMNKRRALSLDEVRQLLDKEEAEYTVTVE